MHATPVLKNYIIECASTVYLRGETLPEVDCPFPWKPFQVIYIQPKRRLSIYLLEKKNYSKQFYLHFDSRNSSADLISLKKKNWERHSRV